MLKYVLALLLLATPAFAQQPPQDPQIMVYRQLLDNANAQLAQVAAQLQQANTKVTELQKQLDEKQPKSGPPPGK